MSQSQRRVPKELRIPYTWEERRPEIHDGVLFIPDHYDRHREWVMPKWEAIFGNSNRVAIEYCAGNGSWIVQKAQDQTQNWIAVEWRLDRAQKIWAKKQNLALNNLFIVCGDALIFSRDYLHDQSIATTYVNFPDPWPKSKHAKHRIFQRHFVADLARTAAPKGNLIVVTDDPLYGNQIEQAVLAHADWKSVFFLPHYVTTWEGYGTSFFDALWRAKGREIRYFHFLKEDNA